MSTASNINTALRALPAAINDYLTKQIPTIEVPVLPTDTESAQLAVGILAYNECRILKEFEGFRPLYILLHLGAWSNAAIASVLLRSWTVPGGAFYTASSNWFESFHVPGDTASMGGVSPAERLDTQLYSDINSYLSNVSAWYGDADVRIEADELAYSQGLVLPYDDIADLPAPIPLPVPVDPGLPPAVYFLFWLVKLICDSNVLPVLRGIAREIIRRIQTGGDVNPLLHTFKKFAFLKKNDPTQGMADYTSILLLNADKPIELINSLGDYDIFLDTKILDEDEVNP